MSKMREQINNAQADCNKTSKELENLGKSETDSGKKATDASKNFENLKNVLADMGKVVAGAVTAIGAGAVMAGEKIVSLSKDVAEMQVMQSTKSHRNCQSVLRVIRNYPMQCKEMELTSVQYPKE